MDFKVHTNYGRSAYEVASEARLKGENQYVFAQPEPVAGEVRRIVVQPESVTGEIGHVKVCNEEPKQRRGYSGSLLREGK